MNTFKQNIALIVGIAIPVIVMLLIAGIIYLPKLFSMVAPPQYDFMYAVGDGVVYPAFNGNSYPYAYPYRGVRSKYVYQVVDGKLTKREAGTPPLEYGKLPVVEIEPKFYLYNIASRTSKPITFEDAQKYFLDTSAKSPDGFEIVRGGGGGGMFPFFYSGSNYDKKYIKKDRYVEELSLNLPSDYYGEFFVAWVLK